MVKMLLNQLKVVLALFGLIGFECVVCSGQTVEVIQSTLAKQRDAILSMDVKYSSETRYERQLVELGAHEGTIPRLREHCMFKGIKKYRHVEYFASIDAERPRLTRTAIFDGAETRIRLGRMLTIQEPESNFASGNLYLHLLKWPNTSSEIAFAEKHPGESDFLPEMLADVSNWQIRRNPQYIGTTRCTVLRNNDRKITLWLNPEQGYALVKYEQEWSTGRRRKTVVNLGSFVEVSPGTFLPHEIEVTNHQVVTESEEEVLGKSSVKFEIADLSLNSVADAAFVLEPLNGELVVDNRNGVSYTHVPFSNNKLFENVQRAKSLVDAEQSQLRKSLGLTFVAFLFATALLFWLARLRAKA